MNNVMRNKKIQQEIKKSQPITAIGEDYANHPISDHTNSGTGLFCPFLDHERLSKMIKSKRGEGIIHLTFPTGMEKPDSVFHYVQLLDFTSGVYCHNSKDLVQNFDKCIREFTKCKLYKEVKHV